MKLSMKFVFLCIILINTNFAQDDSRIATPILFFLQNTNIDAINSVGFSNINRSMAAEIGNGNPAALGNFLKMSAGAMFQYNTGIDYFSILDLQRAKQWLPSNFGFVVPYHDLRIGISYHQKYSSFLDYGKIEISTVQNPQGTGEFFSASSEVIIHSPSVLISNSLYNIFTENDRLDMGGQIYIDIWEEVDKVSKTTSTLSANDLSWKIGLSYAFNPRIKMAAVYEKGIDMEGELIQKDSDLFIIEPFDTTGLVQVSKIKIMQKINMPDKLSLGVTAQTSEQILLSSAFTFVYWNEINKQFKNQIDFSANAIYNFSEMLDFTMGVYITDREVKDRELFDFSLPQNAAYLNFGIKANMENFVLQAEILDSHLVSADQREHTIFKAGLNYEFDINN